MGVTHIQWFNSYLERLSTYHNSAIDDGRKPTIQEFHIELSNDSENSFQWFSKVAAAINRATRAGSKRTGRGLVEALPMSLTNLGVERTLEELRQKTEGPAQHTKKLSRAEQIGLFVMENKLQLFDPKSANIVDPKAIFPIPKTQKNSTD